MSACMSVHMCIYFRQNSRKGMVTFYRFIIKVPYVGFMSNNGILIVILLSSSVRPYDFTTHKFTS